MTPFMRALFGLGGQGSPALGNVSIGINVEGIVTYSAGNAMVNITASGFMFQDPDFPDQPVQVPRDAEGYPDKDFIWVPHWQDPSSTETRILEGQFVGYAQNITQTGFSATHPLLEVLGYNAGTNLTTFRITFAPGDGSNVGWLFSGTRKTGGAGGTTNTGLSGLICAAPGYTVAEILAGKVWTDEYVYFLSKFSSLRLMDFMNTNLSEVINYVDLPQSSKNKTMNEGVCYDHMMLLCNLTNTNAYVCAGIQWTDDCIKQVAQQFDAQLNPEASISWEYGNELWNFGIGYRFGFNVLRTTLEVNGAGGDITTRAITSMVRASGVVTIELDFEPDWEVGQQLSVIAGPGGEDYNVLRTITSVDGSTVTWDDDREDANLFRGSTTNVVYDRTGTLFLPDGQNSIYVLFGRYNIRRLKETSDLLREVGGDGKMNTRFCPTWADLMVNNPDSEQLEYVKQKWTARPVGGGFILDHSAYFTTWAGAPYLLPPERDDPTKTYEEVVQMIIDAAGLGKLQYNFEGRRITAAHYNMKNIWYEGGTDLTMDYDTWLAHPEAAIIRNTAMFDPRIKPGLSNFVKSWLQVSNDGIHWYAGSISSATGDSSQYQWSVSDSWTNDLPPKISVLAELNKKAYPAAVKNTIPGTVNTALYAERYDPTGPVGNFDGGNKRSYGLYDCTFNGNGHIAISYGCISNGLTVKVEVNGVLLPDTYALSNAGSFNTVFNFPPFPGVFHKGFNWIILYPQQNQGHSVELKTMVVTQD